MALVQHDEGRRDAHHETIASAVDGANTVHGRKRISRLRLVGILVLGISIASLALFLRDASQKPTRANSFTNFDLPVETSGATLVCPLNAAFDNREGHGIAAAMKTREQISNRREDAEKAGCEEWREGVPIALDGRAIARAKDLESRGYCGMLLFEGGYVFSCALRNPPASSLTSNSLRWGRPALLRGTLHSAEFDNCCENGVSKRQVYAFIRLREPVSVPADGPGEPTLQHVTEIQLGSSLQDSSGAVLTVWCGEIRSGNTGHYALPVYCSEPALR